LLVNTELTIEQTDLSHVKVYSLELNTEFAEIATQLIALAGLSDIAKVIVGAADESLGRLVKQGDLKNIDMLFLDHVEDLYSKDFEVVEKLGLFKQGAVVVADNVVRPGAPEYRELMRSKDGWKSEGVRGLIWPGNFEVSAHLTSRDAPS
jgi:catechol O-methyltransferase